jgi:regulator of sirC expression with transglutaminase-like and TPR domain
MVARDENEWELDRAALLIAAEEYPGLEVEKYLDQLDSFADRARASGGPNIDSLTQVMQLGQLLFHELGFRGNVENYFDARNSFLNEVIDRRVGIPITLSLIFIEVARRLGLKIFGVGMPGHFIVKYVNEDAEILIDPFNGGRLLSEERCREMIGQLSQGAMLFQPSFLRSVTKKQILARMLQNLKGIYGQAKDNHKTLSVIDRLLLINPDAVPEIRDRGLILSSLAHYAQAQADLKEYLRRVPDAEDAKEVRERIGQLQQKQAQFN